MDKNSLKAEHDPVMMQAAEWLLTLQDRDVSAEHISAWQHWLAADACHRQAFDRLQEAQETIDSAAVVPWPAGDDVAADTYDGTQPVSEWKNGVHSSVAMHRRRRRFLASALAAAAGIAGVTIYSGVQDWLPDADHRAFTTQVGELRRLPLTDGSTVTLGGESSISVELNASQRTVTLNRGEAYFEVIKDPKRPFIVDVGDTAVRAIGTAFEVRRGGDRITVAVSEGLVEVEGTEDGKKQVAAGQQIRVNLQGMRTLTAATKAATETSVVALAPTAVATWREGRRQYRAELLSEVIADLSRYSTRRIDIAEPAIGQLAITGTVFERDVDKWLNSLQSALPVRVVRREDGSVLIERAF